MAPYGFSLTKEITWRGGLERFSNVYHYNIPGATTEGFGWDAFLADLMDRERRLFSDQVNYVEGRAWGPTYEAKNETPQLKADSITQYIGDLVGAGYVADITGPDVYRESAVVVSWYVGRNPTTGRKRFLRKYFHVCRLNAAEPEGVVVGGDPMSAALIENYRSWYDGLKNITSGGIVYNICTPGGDELPLGTETKILPHLHIRQLKQ